MKQTKIVASISDQRCDVDFIRNLFDAGMNVVRMNTAHATPEGIRKIINTVACKTAERSGKYVVKKEFLAAHSSFYCRAENIKGKHVEKQMAYRTVSEHVCDKLPV